MSESRRLPCGMPFSLIWIGEPSGDVYPCCEGAGHMPSLGNVNTQDIMTIWEHGFAGLRQQMINGTEPDFCRACFSRQFLGANPADLQATNPASIPELRPAGRVPPNRLVLNPEPPRKLILSRPEYEFLRVAATPPDWEALRALGQQVTDWNSLGRLSFSHQLEGVVAWRMLDARLAEVVPEATKEVAQSHLNELIANRDLWLRSAAPAFVALNASGLPWITASVPVQYAPLGLPDEVWPRVFDHAHIYVPEDQHLEACRVISGAGAVERERIPGHPFTLFDTEGFILGLGRYLDPQPASEIWERSPELFKDRHRVVMQGTEMWTPSPEWMVCWLANHTGESYGPNTCPLPLWGLARVWNWRNLPDYDFSVEKMAEGIRAAIACSNKVGNWGQEMLFGMEMTRQVYGFEIPEEFAPELAKEWVTPRCVAPQTHAPQDPDVVLEISKSWSAETVLFDKYTSGVADKEAAGLLRRRQKDG